MNNNEWEYVVSLIEKITSKEAERIIENIRLAEAEKSQKKINTYFEMRAAVEELFHSYNQLDQGTADRRLADWLLKMHQEEAVISGNEIKLQHNAFVLRYIIGQSLETKDICKQLGINISMCQKYINAVFDDFMIYLYGFDGIKPH